MKKTTIAITLCFLFFSAVTSNVSAFPANAPAPTLTNVSPNQAYNYQPTTISITGTNFVATPIVLLGNVALANVAFVNDTTLTATVPADLPGGVYTITATNPDSQSESLLNAFTVLMSGNGTLGAWQTTSSMTIPRRMTGVVISGNYIYVLGGSQQGFAPLSSVEHAMINADGSLGSWQTTTATTSARTGLAAVQANGYVYALGPDTSVEWAGINADGSLGSWQTTSSMTTTRAVLAAATSGGYVYAIGGNNGMGSNLNTVEFAPINSDGTLGIWQITSPMITGRSGHAIVIVSNYIYAIGGQSNSSGSLIKVERATINSDGSLGIWQAVTSMNTARCYVAGVTMRGYIYAIGGAGCTMPLPVYATVERAKINLDGSLGLWQVANFMTSPREHHSAVQNGRYIYVLGGDQDYVTPLDSVEKVEVDPPSLTKFTPSAVSSDNPMSLVIAGANLLPTPSLQLGSTYLTAGFVSTTTLTTTIPSGWANGWYTATLTNGDGRTAALPNALRVDGSGQVLVGDYGVSINDGALFTNQVAVTLSISSRADTAIMQVSNDGGFSGAQWETYASHKTWQITQFGNYVIPRVVYVRYKDLNGNTSATSSDDIILDVTAPTGSVQIIPGASISNSKAPIVISRPTQTPGPQRKPNTVTTLFLPLIMNLFPCNVTSGNPNVTLKISATDDVSGVGGMMISNRADFNCASWETYATTRAWYVAQGTTTAYVKFRDNAGNVSAPTTATITR